MIRNIIFDLGNVIIQNPNLDTILNFTSDLEEAQKIIKCVFQSSEWKMLDKGEISYEDAIKILSQNALPEISSKIPKVMLEWYSYQPINEDTIRIAKDLKENGYRLYVLSNMAITTYEYFKGLEFFKLCEGIVISGYEKVTKPDKEIFLRLLKRYKLKPEECLLIDDDDTNRSFDTANVLGILGRKVRPNDSNDIKELLKEFKIEEIGDKRWMD